MLREGRFLQYCHPDRKLSHFPQSGDRIYECKRVKEDRYQKRVVSCLPRMSTLEPSKHIEQSNNNLMSEMPAGRLEWVKF